MYAPTHPPAQPGGLPFISAPTHPTRRRNSPGGRRRHLPTSFRPNKCGSKSPTKAKDGNSTQLHDLTTHRHRHRHREEAGAGRREMRDSPPALLRLLSIAVPVCMQLLAQGLPNASMVWQIGQICSLVSTKAAITITNDPSKWAGLLLFYALHSISAIRNAGLSTTSSAGQSLATADGLCANLVSSDGSAV